MAWKFFNIGKANEEIARLEAENVSLKQQLAEAGKTPEDVTKHAESIAKENEGLKARVEAAESKIIDLEKAKASLESDATKHAEALAAKDAEVEKLAAAKALEITSKQGQPPLAMGTPPANPASTEKPKTEVKGIARVKAALDAEYAQKK